MTRRPRTLALVGYALVGCALAAPLYASANEGANTQRFSPSPVLSPYLTLDGTFTHGTGALALSARGTFEARPLAFYKDGERTAEIIEDRLTLDLSAAYGLRPWLDIGLNLPMVPRQTGAGLVPNDALSTRALGDPTLALKATLLDKRQRPIGLAAIAWASAPLGDPDGLTGETSASGGLRMAAELPLGARLDLGANLGYRHRPHTVLEDLALDSELTMGLAASWRLSPTLSAVTELNVDTPANAPFAEASSTPADLNLGARYLLWHDLGVVAGIGAGVSPGYGSPTWRGFAGLEWTPRRHDFDGDLVLDEGDACVRIFGSATNRGCPASAGHALVPPPMPDDPDGDGIADPYDQCPRLPEDHDGFLDADGCPDHDNDLDLLADDVDGAPLAPEDWDDFEDADGRPDLDNDRDGVADYLDACPLTPGGEDGCGALPTITRPDASSPVLTRAKGPDAPLVLGDTLHPVRPILFKTGARGLTPSAAAALDGLAQYLAAHPELKKLEVGVHTAGRAHLRWKRRLSQRRAQVVRAALISRGVDKRRLTARGYGPDAPVVSNQTRAGRDQNRRVEVRVLPDGLRHPATRGLPGGAPPPRQRWLPSDAVVLRLGTPIEFVPVKAVLTPAGQATVKALAAQIRAKPAYRIIEIAVHTAGGGNLLWKRHLSVKRAKAIRRALIGFGVDAARLKAKGYGARRRLTHDRSRAARAKNRRVELVVLQHGDLAQLGRLNQ